MAFEDTAEDLPWEVPAEVRQKLTIASLRPFALRVLWRILTDEESPGRLRLDAAKLIVDKTRDGEDGAGDQEDVIDLEVVRLAEELRRRG